jgi:hypothetical protein
MSIELTKSIILLSRETSRFETELDTLRICLRKKSLTNKEWKSAQSSLLRYGTQTFAIRCQKIMDLAKAELGNDKLVIPDFGEISRFLGLIDKHLIAKEYELAWKDIDDLSAWVKGVMYPYVNLK